jgi:hypothetical protein
MNAENYASVVHCKKCNAEIVWLKTKTGKAMPVNAASVTEEDMEIVPVLFDHTRHISHFSDCPFAAQFRKSGSKASQEHRAPQ